MWALVSPDGVSASVNLPLHHEVQKFSSGTGSPGCSQKKGHKTFVVVLYCAAVSRLSDKRRVVRGGRALSTFRLRDRGLAGPVSRTPAPHTGQSTVCRLRLHHRPNLTPAHCQPRL